MAKVAEKETVQPRLQSQATYLQSLSWTMELMRACPRAPHINQLSLSSYLLHPYSSPVSAHLSPSHLPTACSDGIAPAQSQEGKTPTEKGRHGIEAPSLLPHEPRVFFPAHHHRSHPRSHCSKPCKSFICVVYLHLHALSALPSKGEVLFVSFGGPSFQPLVSRFLALMAPFTMGRQATKLRSHRCE